MLAARIDRVFGAGVHHAREGVTEVHGRGAVALRGLHGEQATAAAAAHADLDDVARYRVELARQRPELVEAHLVDERERRIRSYAA